MTTEEIITPTVRLPNKPSELIRLALKDLRSIEAKPDLYNINMSEAYHKQLARYHPARGKCSVCAAGAVMAETLKIDPEIEVVPDNFDKDTRHKLSAINELRLGDIRFAVETHLGLPYPSDIPSYINIPSYEREYPEKFHTAWEELATMLESHGL
jgi:hypothetical protein